VVLLQSSPVSSLSASSILPHKGPAITDEIKCYSLPYGGIGFASHLITYYTIMALSRGRSPFTWKKNKCWKLDFTLGAIRLISTTSLAIPTIVRCRHRWQFVLLGIWKMTLSLTLGFISVHAAIAVRSIDEGSGRAGMTKKGVLWWLAFYIPGLAIGLTGLGSLARISWTDWRRRRIPVIVTGIFIGSTVILGTLAIIVLLIIRRQNRQRYNELSAASEMAHSTREMSSTEPCLEKEEIFMGAAELPAEGPAIESLAPNCLNQHAEDKDFELRVLGSACVSPPAPVHSDIRSYKLQAFYNELYIAEPRRSTYGPPRCTKSPPGNGQVPQELIGSADQVMGAYYRSFSDLRRNVEDEAKEKEWWERQLAKNETTKSIGKKSDDSASTRNTPSLSDTELPETPAKVLVPDPDSSYIKELAHSYYTAEKIHLPSNSQDKIPLRLLRGTKTRAERSDTYKMVSSPSRHSLKR